MLEVLWLLLDEYVDLVDEVWVRLLREVVKLEVSHCLVPLVLKLVEGDNTVQVSVLLGNEDVLEFLIQGPFLVLVRAHAVLGFVLAFLLSVESLDAYEVECVGQKIVLDLQV